MFVQRILTKTTIATSSVTSRLLSYPTISTTTEAASSSSTMSRFFSSNSAEDIQSGTVKWFDVKKGFGFIVPEDGSEEVFVHQTAIHAEGFRSLADGETVEFTTLTDNNGRLKAANVTGPMGAFVQGRPPQPRFGGGYSNSNGGGGFGGGGGGYSNNDKY